MSMPAKPDIKSFVHCMCKKSKCLRGCSCAKADVPCSVGCLCLGQLEKCNRTVYVTDSSEDDEPWCTERISVHWSYGNIYKCIYVLF